MALKYVFFFTNKLSRKISRQPCYCSSCDWSQLEHTSVTPLYSLLRCMYFAKQNSTTTIVTRVFRWLKKRSPKLRNITRMLSKNSRQLICFTGSLLSKRTIHIGKTSRSPRVLITGKIVGLKMSRYHKTFVPYFSSFPPSSNSEKLHIELSLQIVCFHSFVMIY